jgi:hypothetical protein
VVVAARRIWPSGRMVAAKRKVETSEELEA